MKVVFYNRDFSGRLPVSGTVAVDRYSKNMIGGCKDAFLSVAQSADTGELMRMLRCPVEIYGDDGGIKWWGYINQVSIPNGTEQRIGLSLDELYNSITARYSSTATAATTNAQSILEYGTKEFSLYVSNADATQAAAARDLYIAEHQYPRPEFIFSGGSQTVEIECLGWFDTLGWEYYSDADTTNTVNTTQIVNIVTGSGQFFNGTIIEDAAGISSNEYRDGTGTALGYVNQLLNAGTSNGLPLLAYVDKARYLHVYERSTEPTTPDYLMRDDNTLETLIGEAVLPQDCITAAWVNLKNITSSAFGLSTMRPFFIESAEYNAGTDKTTYRPAGSFEQSRLARYIQAVTDSNSGGGYGSSGVSSGSNYGYRTPRVSAPPILEGSLGEPGVIALPYASVFLSSSGDVSDSNGITIDSAARDGTGVNIQVTADAATGIYLVSCGTGGLLTNDGYANVTMLGAGYPSGHSARCTTNAAEFAGASASAIIINPTGGVISLSGDVWDYTLAAYLTPSQGWLTVIRLGDA